MAAPEDTPPPSEPKPKRDDEPGKADALALGIGCLVFLLFFIAIILVSATRE